MKTWECTLYVEAASGHQVFRVEAETREQAWAIFRGKAPGEPRIVHEEVEVTDLSEPDLDDVREVEREAAEVTPQFKEDPRVLGLAKFVAFVLNNARRDFLEKMVCTPSKMGTPEFDPQLVEGWGRAVLEAAGYEVTDNRPRGKRR